MYAIIRNELPAASPPLPFEQLPSRGIVVGCEYPLESDDDVPGTRWTFATAYDVCTFLWGRDTALYSVFKGERQIVLPPVDDLAVIQELLELPDERGNR